MTVGTRRLRFLSTIRAKLLHRRELGQGLHTYRLFFVEPAISRLKDDWDIHVILIEDGVCGIALARKSGRLSTFYDT